VTGFSAGKGSTISRSQMGSELEAKSRLKSVLSVCEDEGEALRELEDERLDGVLQAMTRLKAEIVSALASLTQPPSHGRG
jgi:hypothetical protein